LKGKLSTGDYTKIIQNKVIDLESKMSHSQDKISDLIDKNK
jgi:hypothetical protein